MIKYLAVFLFLVNLTQVKTVKADTNPDELYRQGRFAEAEKSYAKLDMDHPKDIRYRYNRGCAAYRNSDDKGAMAAFSSVLRRSKDARVDHKAYYNLGNIAFNQGDFATAVDHFKQALLINPESENSRYNLELSMRELEKQKKDPAKKPETQSSEDGSQSDDKNDPTEGEPEEKKPGENMPEKPKQKSKQGDNDKESGKQEETRPDDPEKKQGESPPDLSGELKSSGDLPEKREENKSSEAYSSMIDQKKAEALLDNIKEDRSRFLRFQIPQDKRHGVLSGKDW